MALAGIAVLGLAGCGVTSAIDSTLNGPPQLGRPQDLTGFIGAVVGDEPRAVRVGQQILQANGSAADAAAAMGFALAVTLPSRAGLGGGGGCLVLDHRKATGVMYEPAAPAAPGGDRPAAVPMAALGLLALQHRFGVLPAEQDIAPAEELARLGVPVSTQLASDLSVVSGALAADPAAGAVFAPGGQLLSEGDLLQQTDLGATLARIRIGGAQAFYEGDAARLFAAAATAAGGAMVGQDLTRAAALLTTPITLRTPHNVVAFLPMPEIGGIAAAAAYRFVEAHHSDEDGATARALGAAKAARGGMRVADILAGGGGEVDDLGPMPATTSFAALDRAGNAVVCAETMGNLFGTGRVAEGTGLLLAAAPGSKPAPLLGAALAYAPSGAFRAAVGGAGQQEAPSAVALGLWNALTHDVAMPQTVTKLGRINVIACAKYLPGSDSSCTWTNDPRGNGLAVGND